MNQTLRAWHLCCALVLGGLPLQPVVAQTADSTASTATIAHAPVGDSHNRAAFEAAVWAMPIVSVDAMRDAYFRDAGARYNDIVYWSRPADWKNQTTTPNSSSLYVYFNYNLKDGPVVLDIPAADGIGVFGSVLNSWQIPLADVGPEGEDRGNGARYLLLPPGFKGELPAGYVPLQSDTYNGYALIRVTPGTLLQDDLGNANAFIRKMHVSSLANASGDAPQRFIEMDGKLFDGIVQFDDTYFARLARMVSEEPALPRDAGAYVRLRALGIEPGKPFAPDPAMRARMNVAAQEARASFRQTLLSGARPWWPGLQWGTVSPVPLAVKTHFTFDDGQGVDTALRGALYFLAYAPPQKLGKATFYLTSWRDQQGQLLDGSAHYRLRVPPNVPARQFWAVNVYDCETSGFIRQAPRIGVDSYDKGLQRNADGSIDVYFGPAPPAGKTGNWIYTAPGKPWFAAFRLYGPEPAIFDRSWTMADIARQ
ncbi:DUF1214 domain-containing protein [Paraburkholderia rhynchosiae]|uniref:DUF1254 domain-containing protein n=1 Tax=Paraburkholderia rhynchosiae TaxID=487049 RepID=A0A2N7W583_9BURK|nr:DUF1214 domain-containing protein [Paraburkholderia rhynchosiae]PMS24558.1 hypothetical protein C0Z16_30500 [Paraburkholderia rhynchosiae]CAB3735124.1 hypothetical protein LMG27174_06180 [Paraburkholderia rhynchosiae]